MTNSSQSCSAGSDRALLAALVHDAMRFAIWAAGEGITPVDGQPARAPEDFLYEYSCATDIEDWDGLAEVARDAVTGDDAQGPVLSQIEAVASALRIAFDSFERGVRIDSLTEAEILHLARVALAAQPPAAPVDLDKLLEGMTPENLHPEIPVSRLSADSVARRAYLIAPPGTKTETTTDREEAERWFSKGYTVIALGPTTEPQLSADISVADEALAERFTDAAFSDHADGPSWSAVYQNMLSLIEHIRAVPQAVRKPVVLEPLPTDRYAVDDPWHRPQSSDEQARWRPSKEEIKKIILSAIESKADAEIYGVSSARKINGYRAVTATEAILALSRPNCGGGK